MAREGSLAAGIQRGVLLVGAGSDEVRKIAAKDPAVRPS